MAIKTTINLPEALYKKVKRVALDRGVTVTSLIRSALEKEVEPKPKADPFKMEDLTFKGKPGFQPGVDPANGGQMVELSYGDRL